MDVTKSENHSSLTMGSSDVMMIKNDTNASDSNFSFRLESDESIITFTVLSTILCSLAIIANFTTMLIVIFLPKQTPFTKLFVNLAICDILGTLAIYVGDVAFRAGTHWNLAIETCNMLFKVGGTCFSLFFFTSAVTLLVFAIMRFIGITKPHSFGPLFESTKKVLLYILVCWLISLCFTLPTIVCDNVKQRCDHISRQFISIWGSYQMAENEMTMSNFTYGYVTNGMSNLSTPTPYTTTECMSKIGYSFCAKWKYIWAGGKALILVIVVCLYLSLSRDLFVRTASSRLSKRKDDETVRDRVKDKHAFITIVILLVILVSTGVPYIAVKVYRRATYDQNIIRVYNNFITYFPYINFILDPIVYSIRSPDINAKYRSIFGRIFCSKCARTQEEQTTKRYTIVKQKQDSSVVITMNDVQTTPENGNCTSV